MTKNIENELITIKAYRGTNQQIKVLASLEAMTVPEYLNWLVSRAYEVAIRNIQLKHRK